MTMTQQAPPPPRLLAVVHTEEEFDWNAPFSRHATATTNAKFLSRGQSIFEKHGIKPIYVVDYPMATDPTAVEILKQYQDSGAATIGTHLHPWVSPPFDEEINARNSYPGNLPADLERAKIEILTDTIEKAFDRRPWIYLAGRYGFGPNTARILEELGYRLDLSPSPPFNFGADGGPDFEDFPLRPRRIGGITQIPHTAAYIGPLASQSNFRRLWSRQDRLATVARALLAKSRLLRRVRLSPEGADLMALQALTDTLLADRVDLFVLSFHSPSLGAGWTPYVRNDDDVAGFLETIDGYLTWFRCTKGGAGVEAGEVRPNSHARGQTNIFGAT